MKLLFVIENYYPYHDAASKVLFNLLNSHAFKNHDVHVLAKGQNNEKDGDIYLHSVDNFNDSFFRKALLKIFKFRFISNKKFVKKFKKEILKIDKKFNFDQIIYVCGCFDLLFCLDKTLTNKLNIIYLDIFNKNYFFKNSSSKYLSKLEKTALEEHFSKIFILPEYSEYMKELGVAKPVFTFNIPIVFSKVTSKTNPYCVHAGAFFKHLRDPYHYFEFCELLSKTHSNLKFFNLGFLPKNLKFLDVPKNVCFSNRINNSEYDKVLNKASCLVLVDNNKKCIQIPSKLFEYIGLNKKIIFFGYKGKESYNLVAENKNVYFIDQDEEMNDTHVFEFLKFLKIPAQDCSNLYRNYQRDLVAITFLKNCGQN